ncbi:HlyD family secretion protein [Pseudonocardia spinosispora]|uniref:HlyD family secretion protein n=1 Tax=Pseudonocardia spinosispora TaxID=103441 RepID=UPI000412B3CD|nr:efflux RND transporter periplasmic adaptor subunit [Pseudonocardia spinosispora]
MPGEQDLLPRLSVEWTEHWEEDTEPRGRHLARRVATVAVLAVATLTIGVIVMRAALAALPSLTRTPELLDRAASLLSLGTTDLFVVPGRPLLSTLINAGVAGGVWTVFAVLALRVVRPTIDRAPARPRAERVDRVGQIPKPTRVIFAVVAVVSLVELGGFNGNYLLYSSHYVSTENATVDGDRIEINAPVSGVVTNWALTEGSQVSGNEIVGRIRPVGGGARPMRTVRAPGAGAVAVDNVVDGAYVEAGTNLATAYDPSRIYVTARINEDNVEAVAPGAIVDLTVDAFPDTPMTGIVQVVQSSTASPLRTASVPGAADPSTPQAVIQYVPVKIALLDTAGHVLSPGMNVVAHIRK